MRTNGLKKTLAVLLLGTTFGFGGGCIGNLFQQFIVTLPVTLLTEFVTDNDTVFDLFPD